MLNENLRVFHWNINGLNNSSAGLLELKQFLSVNQFDIICLNEAHCENLHFYNYSSLVCTKDLSVFVKNNIRFHVLENINLNNVFESITVKINGTVFFFCYLRDGKSSVGISTLIEKVLFQYCSIKKIIVIGDLNARMLSLGNTRSNCAGNALEKFLERYDNFLCLNRPYQFTFEKEYQIPVYRKVQSILDLCLATIEATPLISELDLLHDPHSDHFPLLLELHSGRSTFKNEAQLYKQLYPLRAKNLQFIKTIPKSFGIKLHAELEDRILSPDLFNAQELWFTIEKSIYEALKKADLLSTPKIRKEHRPLPEEIWQLRNSDRQLFKRKVREFRTNQWKTFVESIDCDHDQASIWRKFNNSLGKKRSTVKYGDSTVEVEHIRNLFYSNSKPDIPAPDIIDITDDSKEDLFGINFLFTADELTAALTCLGSSAPGPDGIPFNVYKAFTSESQYYLLSLLNKFFTSGNIPNILKNCLQVALPKSSPGDFRPITLMNCILKIYEKLIYNRIYPIMDPFIPHQQFGFRKNRSSSDQAANLIMNIERHRSKNLYCGVIFIDIKKAFDRIDRNIILNDLKKFGFNGMTLAAIKALINDNVYRVLFQDSLSSEYTSEAGCPQGSILSPLLWNFYFREVTSLFDPKTPFLFADDLALVVADRSHAVMIRKLTAAFKNFNDWCYSKRIEVSASKTKFMDVSKRFKKRKLNSSEEHSNILFKCLLTGQISRLETVTSYKYLGVIIDSDLCFDKYVSSIVNEVTLRINLIRRISKTVKLSRENIEKFYQGYVRGFLQYGSTIWSTFSNDQISKIESADRKGLRLCIGALLKTRNDFIEEESTLCSLKNLSQRAQLRLGCRVLHSPEFNFFRDSLYEHAEESNLAMTWISNWSSFDIHRASDINKAYQTINLRLSKKRKDKTKYFKNFWKERLLARIRMNVIPTRSWAFSLRLSDTSFCRHCGIEEETAYHLFASCTVLDYSILENYYYENSFLTEPLNFTTIRDLLKSPPENHRLDLEEKIILFVRENNLFKV
jgi:hypothetical protein